MSLTFHKDRSAIIHSSWLDPRKVREMTIVGSKRMIVYDDVALQEKIRVFDARVERPPHYDTFAEFHYAYHYGDTYAPYVKQEEPLKSECQHFLDCIQQGKEPLTHGEQGLELVRILEASSESLQLGGGQVPLQPDAGTASAGGQRRAQRPGKQGEERQGPSRPGHPVRNPHPCLRSISPMRHMQPEAQAFPPNRSRRQAGQRGAHLRLYQPLRVRDRR